MYIEFMKLFLKNVLLHNIFDYQNKLSLNKNSDLYVEFQANLIINHNVYILYKKYNCIYIVIKIMYFFFHLNYFIPHCFDLQSLD